MDSIMAIGVIAIILLIIVPIKTGLMDFFLIVNLSLSLVILLVTIYAKDPMQFSVFPTMLLICTLFRLALNVKSTTLILGNKGEAGAVIRTFGQFVTSGNVVVGFIIFLIIVIIQFLVITKGSERIAEVAARFTLDSLPGKQMAIDADLNAGLIDEHQAKDRRKVLGQETDFYGAMDGASKFVKGDAIVAIIITVINVVGGVLMGVLSGGMSWDKVIDIYVLATVGDGLSSQLSALMISIAAGIIVTRASSDGGLGQEVTKQLFAKPEALMVCGGILIFMMVIPGFPKPILLMVGALLFVGGFFLRGKSIIQKEEPVEMPVPPPETELDRFRNPERVFESLGVEPMMMEFGYSLLSLVDASQGGTFLDRVVMIRRQCAMELGIVVPVVRLQDNMQLSPNEYVIYIRGEEVSRGEVLPSQFLAMNTDGLEDTLQGIKVKEPVFNMPSMWIPEDQKAEAELQGCTIVDPVSVMATHLHEIIKKHAHELLGRQDVKSILDTLERSHPSLVEEVVPKLLSLGEVQKVFSGLLQEGVPVRDVVTILETLGNQATLTRNTELLTEYVRMALRRTITRKFIGDQKEARVITVDPRLEQQIMDKIQQNEYGSQLVMNPEEVNAVIQSLGEQITKMTEVGLMPVVLVSPAIRLHFKRLADQIMSEITVLSYGELEQSVRIRTMGMVGI